MTCGSCNGGCNCNGTVRSRRCRCYNSAIPLGEAKRDETNCCDNHMFVNNGSYQEPYLDPTESYGSGLSRVGLYELRVYENNVRRMSNREVNRALATRSLARGDTSRGIQPMTTLEAANAIRFGKDISIQ